MLGRDAMKGKTIWLLLSLLVGLLLLFAVGADTALAQTPVPEPATAGTAESEAGEAGAAATESSPLDDVVVTRTPAPTATPGVIAEGVSQLTAEAGLAAETFLGLPADDWINLGISLLTVLAGYLVGTWLIRRVLPQVVRRTGTEIDDQLLDAAGPEVRWLVVLLALRFATTRLTFLGAGLKAVLGDVYYVLAWAVATRIVLHLIDLVSEAARQRSIQDGREDELAPVVTLLVRLGRVVVVLGAIVILLSHFGVSVIGFAAVLGILGLGLSLAAQDTIADAIAGFTILIDRPFRVGDRIEIEGIDTWGDVTDIGLRTTRIRTRDNRLVIVPNSTIGKNEVVNYTFPDPRYRIQTHVGIAYGTDIEAVRRLIVDTVRQVEGVLPDKPVDALYNEMGDSAMIFRVRWWIESYEDTRRVMDRVHTILQVTLDAAGIEMPGPTQNVIFHGEPQALDRIEKTSG
jgi:MscS family membrane protein